MFFLIYLLNILFEDYFVKNMLGFFQFERRKFNVYKYKTCSAYTIADHVSACLLTSFFAQKFFEIVNICTLKETCYKIDLLDWRF